MKLAKLSLAAIMTVGAMSTMSAGSLEEAIKGVELSGYARYRFDDKNTGDHRNRYTLNLEFVTPVVENVNATIELDADARNMDDQPADQDGDVALDLAAAFLTFTPNDALEITAGKQDVAGPIDDTAGTGIVAQYAIPAGVTLAGMYFDDIEEGGVDNVYGAGVVFDKDTFGAQLWYVGAETVVSDENADSLFAEASGKVAMVDAKVQYATADRDWEANKASTLRLQVGADVGTVGLKAGYVTNDDDNGNVAIDGSSSQDNDLISAGWGTDFNEANADYIFIGAKTKFGKFGVSADYVMIDDQDAAGNDENAESELTAKLSYKATKKLNTYVRYRTISNVVGDDSDAFRFEAKYSF
jgi:hypothetical protein